MKTTFFYTTERRRLLQPLWSAFQDVLCQQMARGVVIAVSGGPDSRALLEALARWSLRHHGRFIVASIDHQTRPESQYESEAVRARAMALGFDAVCVSIQSMKKDESTLRSERYNALWSIADTHNCQSVCLAHHADDEAEGVCLHLLGWGGGRQAASMGERVQHERGLLLRPFLRLERSQLHAALFALGIKDAFVDPLDQRGLSRRAQVRHHVLPYLSQLEPQTPKKLSRFAQSRESDESALSQLATKLVRSQTENSISVEVKRDMPDAVVLRAIQLALSGLAPGTDFRKSGPTCYKLLLAARKSAQKLGRGIDRTAILFNLPKQEDRVATDTAQFEFSGIVAHLNNFC